MPASNALGTGVCGNFPAIDLRGPRTVWSTAVPVAGRGEATTNKAKDGAVALARATAGRK